MSRDDLVEENLSTGESKRLSAKERELNFSKVVEGKEKPLKRSRRKNPHFEFSDEDLKNPKLEKQISKVNRAEDKLDKAYEKVPKKKKLIREKTYDEVRGKRKTNLCFEEVEKAEAKVAKETAKFRYQKAMIENPELSATPLSRLAQKRLLMKNYAKESREAGRVGNTTIGNIRNAFKEVAKKAGTFVKRKGAKVLLVTLPIVFLIFMLGSSVSTIASYITGFVIFLALSVFLLWLAFKVLRAIVRIQV